MSKGFLHEWQGDHQALNAHSSSGNPQLDPHHDLPLEVIVPSGADARQKQQERKSKPALPKYFLLPFVPLLLFTGAVIGIYVQPPALRLFLQVTGLKPGGGTSHPIAVPVEMVEPASSKKSTIRSVVALGRLLPEGKVITVSPPFGAGDARIEEIKVAVGTRVERGDILALLDNNQSLEAAVTSAEANVALQKATLEQTRKSIGASFEEAKEGLEKAKAAANLATQDLARQKSLSKKGASVQADLDHAEAAATQALREVAKAEATMSRYKAVLVEDQPDVVVAARKLDAAMADLNRARRDLARGVVTAPVSGTILEIYARPGEKPGAKGILDVGDTERMTAELEVYQAEIGLVSVGQHVELSADVVGLPFQGMVQEIGYAVERQTVVRDDPAANTDARIVKVKVRLDGESSKRASKLTNLEVTGRIAVEDDK